MRTDQKLAVFQFRNSSQWKSIRWFALATTVFIFFMMLSSTTGVWNNLFHTTKHYVHAATGTNTPRVNAPFFNSPVPFNQTAIFWFGDVTSTDTYTDVRVGYNSQELYIDLQTVDRYLWYDTNTKSPNVNVGDNASVYISVANNTYKFQAAVNGYTKRSNYQQAYVANGNAWTATKVPFGAFFSWRGHGFNGPEDRGWSMEYHIPFSSLGVSTPSKGTVWKLAVKVHNQDNAANSPSHDKWWPVSASETNPSGWGDLAFGIPTYQSPSTQNQSTFTIRNGLNNQVVNDAMVGGSLGCGNNVSNVWTQLENTSYPGANHVNIQNEGDVSDWNCFSKFYITFPLSSLPHGQSLINAKVTLYEYGNSGSLGKPNPSYIQVAVVNQDWSPSTLTWNNAPLVQENINSIRVNTIPKPSIPWPGMAVTWDVSSAAAAAYAAGQPLRLVFYSTDNQYNTGKYFTSSSVGNWDANGRPTLQMTLGA
ncbi:MAG TPA: hypothetical protein DHW02_09895 [Ktedonobacter sp.]|nr:hypothetical protein [Ktedonobacter sp.]